MIIWENSQNPKQIQSLPPYTHIAYLVSKYKLAEKKFSCNDFTQLKKNIAILFYFVILLQYMFFRMLQ